MLTLFLVRSEIADLSPAVTFHLSVCGYCGVMYLRHTHTKHPIRWRIC